MAAKVLLVEDDNNLREIYEARLMAEGYTIATAKDGEEALSVAKTELPDLIISDVMMPRISGFEMLDILRNTEALKDTKVIMLTALGQADDKTRANSLGADRYLVKSQVTLEDIVKAAHELLEGPEATAPASAPAEAPAPAAQAVAPEPAPAPVPTSVPVATQPVMPVAPAPAEPSISAPPAPPAPQTPPASPAFNPAVGAVPTPAPMPSPTPAAPVATPMVPTPAPTPAAPAQPAADASSTNDEMAAVTTQIDDFVRNAPTSTPQATVNAAQDDAVLADAVDELAETAEEHPTETPVDPEAPTTPSAAMPAESASAPAPATEPIPTPEAPTPTPAPEAPMPTPEPEAPDTAIAGRKVIQPLAPAEDKPGIHELLAREEANSTAPLPTPAAPTTTFTPAGGMPAPMQPPFGSPVVGDHSMPQTPAPAPAPMPTQPEAPAPVPAESPMPTPPAPPTPQTPPTPAKPNDFDPNSISL